LANSFPDNAPPEIPPPDNLPPEIIDAWPTCPACGERRVTSCPVCETTGSDLPRADVRYLPGSDREASPWVACPTCDEVFAASFVRRCVWCGHDFGNGVDVDLPQERADLTALLTARATLAAALMTATLALVAIYFALLVRW
jgi:hypothetical protein